MRRARKLRAGLVLALAFFIAAFWGYFHATPPGTAFKAYNADPEMAYFVSSLAVFQGQPYVFVQHPGTPLTVLGTALLALTYPFQRSSPEGFVVQSLRHPGAFLLMAHALLVLANVACLLALGWKALSVRQWSDAVLAAAVPASFFAFLPQSFFSSFYWSHNSVAFPLGTALLLVLLIASRRRRPVSARAACILGLGAGALAATQLYFATWAIGPATATAVLALAKPGAAAWPRRAAQGLSSALLVLAASAFGFFICTLPILPAYPRLIAWVRALASHQGAYGSGPPGFASWKTWSANLAWLGGGAPFLFLATGVVFMMLIAALVDGRRQWRRDAGLWAASAGLTLQWAATVLLLAKHPSRSYLPALAAFLPPLLAIALIFWRRRSAGRVACLALAGTVLLGCVVTGVLSVRAHARRIAYRAAMDAEVERYLAADAATRGVARPQVLVLWGPGLPDAACYALWMGDQYTDRALRHEISRVCPAEGLAWSNITVLPDGWSSPGPVPAVLIATEQTPRLFPAFAVFGAPELSAVRDPAGVRLAFFRVSVEDGQARPSAR